MTLIMANTGYLIGIGIEAFIILICVVLLALMLTGLLFAWMSQFSQTRLVRAEAKAAAAEARAIEEEERAAQEAAEAEAARAQAEIEAKVKAEAEAAAAEAAAVAAAKKAEEDAKNKPKLAPVEKTEPQPEKVQEKEVVKERIIEKVMIVEQQKAAEPAPAPAPVLAEAAVAEAEEEELPEGEKEFVVVQDGIVFNDSKSITELYEELSPEQQSYFDELREEALTKPDTELAIAKNFVTVKIGKRNLIKLLIKRGITVAEFMLENEALKQLRLSNTNKRGKSAIKIKPTVVQVLDLTSLKVAVDMINLSYEEIMMD